MITRTLSTASNIFDLCERANAVLISTNEITEESVNVIIKQLEANPLNVHALLRSSLIKVLRERYHSPDIFLNPPLTGFSEDGSELIGEGSFGKVYKTKYQGKDVAVKVLRQEPGTNSDHVEPFFREVQLWKEISTCPYITPFYGCSVRINRNPRLIFILVSPLADHSLRKHAMDKNSHRDTCKLIIDVAKGVRDLHKKGYIYGDLHLDNVLVFGGVAKLADFGLMKLTDTVSPFSLAGKYVDLHPGRVSPGVLKGNSGLGRSSKSDIFSYGRLVYELFDPDHQMFKTKSHIEHPPKPPRMMDGSWDGLWELLLDCWQNEPDKRPTADDIVSRLDNIFNKLVANEENNTNVNVNAKPSPNGAEVELKSKPSTKVDDGNSNSNHHSNENTNRGEQDRGQAGNGNNETRDKLAAVTVSRTSSGGQPDQSHLPQPTPINPILINGIPQPQPRTIPNLNSIPTPASPAAVITSAAASVLISTATPNLTLAPPPNAFRARKEKHDPHNYHNHKQESEPRHHERIGGKGRMNVCKGDIMIYTFISTIGFIIYLYCLRHT